MHQPPPSVSGCCCRNGDGFETICTHFAENAADARGAASPPIYQTSTFLYPDADAFAQRRTAGSPHFDYTRVGNPTTAILEAKVARLENGTWCRAFSSGMGAISAALHACLKAGSHVVCHRHAYGPTRTLLDHLTRFGVETTLVGGTQAETILAAVRPETRLIYLESPTSGQMEILELAPITHMARERGILTAFDNSYSTPYFQRPLDLGIDLVIHSATKYINGHSDVVAGLVVGRDPELHARVSKELEFVGASLDPFAAWLMIRGLRTLSLRMDFHQRSGLKVAQMLVEHPAVDCVNHPGLPSHPGHELSKRQMSGYASVMSIKLRDQSREATHRFLDRLRLFGAGVSWGGHESLAIGGTFFSVPPDPPEWLIRLYVGLESTDDLIADLRQALDG